MILPLLLAAILGLASGASAQKLAWLRFDKGCGGTVPDWATSRDNPIWTNLPTADAWAPGKWGMALRALPDSIALFDRRHVNLSIGVGSFTLAFWCRQRFSMQTRRGGYLMFGAVSGSVDDATGDLQLLVSLANNSSQRLQVSGFKAAAATAWAHVALVVDNAVPSIAVFVNGAPRGVWSLPAGVAATGWAFGTRNRQLWSPYDHDEIAVVGRPLTQQEIGKMVAGYEAGEYRMVSCPGPFRLDPIGGPPRVGNPNYRLDTVGSAPGALVALAIGDSRCKHLGADLPIDLGALDPKLKGCLLHTNPLLTVTGPADQTGSFRVPMVIPANALTGTVLYAQAFSLDPTTSALHVSFAWGLGIGH